MSTSAQTYLETRPSDMVANILVCIIRQTNYLLDQQLRAREKAFLAEGGLGERMTRARLDARRKQQHRELQQNLTEEELVIFDILTRPAPELSAAERDGCSRCPESAFTISGISVHNQRNPHFCTGKLKRH